MARSLRALILEDSPEDAELIVLELRRGGYAPEWERVETPDAMQRELDRGYWEIVISDYQMPRFNALEALKLFQASGHDMPFIVVSGTIGEDVAVEIMKAGAHDYIMKDNMTRLCVAVERELRDAGVRRERRRIKAYAKETAERLSSFMDSATDCFMLFDEELKLIEMNKASLDMFGYSRDSVLGRNMKELLPGVIEVDRFREVVATGRPFTADVIAPHATRGDLHFVVKAFKVGEGLGVICTDMTERRRSEEKIRASLREKEVLLQEIHHRTKNNMQVISALLTLQSAGARDEKVVRILQETVNRITSMALVHQKLYQSEDLSKVDLGNYLEDLAKTLLLSYQMKSDRVSLHLDVGRVDVNIDTAIPCGLIMNEMISNSMKHAFPRDRHGEIRVRMRPLDEGWIEFIVGDDGVGVPEDFDCETAQSLGMQLVTNLARHQLQGKLEINTNGGTEIKVVFKELG